MTKSLRPFIVYDAAGLILSLHADLNDAIIAGHQWQLLWPNSGSIRNHPFRVYNNSIKSVLVYDSRRAFRDDVD